MSRGISPGKRGVLITGNWKMYKTVHEAADFIETLAPLIRGSQANVSLAVPFTLIGPSVECARRIDASIAIGAENMHDAQEGAFTGEISAKMLIDVGASFVILGHSERRQLFKESNVFINKKVKSALREGLKPILCVGETSQEREELRTEKVLEEQVLASLEGVLVSEIGALVLAYEPVWAIGTGKVAHPDDIVKAHKFCRHLIEKKWGEEAAKKIQIQYGGSVKPDNAPDLLAKEDVDGLLIGGASLKAETFAEIIMKVKK